jgi:hypothetical protein
VQQDDDAPARRIECPLQRLARQRKRHAPVPQAHGDGERVVRLLQVVTQHAVERRHQCLPAAIRRLAGRLVGERADQRRELLEEGVEAAADGAGDALHAAVDDVGNAVHRTADDGSAKGGRPARDARMQGVDEVRHAGSRIDRHAADTAQGVDVAP